MKTFIKIGQRFLDLIEVYIPTFCLIVTFVSFVIQVVSRYCFGSQVRWTYEMCLTGFLWCLLLAAPYAQREHSHVSFTLFYDKLGERGQLAFRLIGTVFLVICFGILLYPGYDWVQFSGIKKSSTLRIPLNYVYAPFVVFVALTLLHLLRDLIKDIRLLCTYLHKRGTSELEEGERADHD